MIRVAVLVNRDTIPEYAANALTRMVNETEATVPLVVRNEAAGNTASELIRKTLEKPHWVRIRGGQILAHKIWGTPSYKRPVHIRHVPALASANCISCTPVSAGGVGQELPNKTVEKIVNQADVVFRQGFGILKGDILNRPRYGVLSYHHGDPRAYRGGPPGFWEFLHGRSTAGMMLQRLNEELDAGEIIVYNEVDIADARTWRAIQERQYRNSESFLAQAVARLPDPDFEPSDVELGPVHTAPDIKNYIKYMVKNTAGRLRIRR